MAGQQAARSWYRTASLTKTDTILPLCCVSHLTTVTNVLIAGSRQAASLSCHSLARPSVCQSCCWNYRGSGRGVVSCRTHTPWVYEQCSENRKHISYRVKRKHSWQLHQSRKEWWISRQFPPLISSLGWSNCAACSLPATALIPWRRPPCRRFEHVTVIGISSTRRSHFKHHHHHCNHPPASLVVQRRAAALLS